MSKLYHHRVDQIDMSDFCGVDDAESISEDGLDALMRISYRRAIEGWEFIECGRQEDNPYILHLRYQQDIQ